MEADLDEAPYRQNPAHVEVEKVDFVEESLVNVREGHVCYGNELGGSRKPRDKGKCKRSERSG